MEASEGRVYSGHCIPEAPVDFHLAPRVCEVKPFLYSLGPSF